MKMFIIGVDKNESPKELRELSEISEASESLEELIKAWLCQGRTIVISKDPHVQVPALGFSFQTESGFVAQGVLPLEELDNNDYEPLNQSVIYFDDQEGYRPDDAWFEERDERLGIYFDEDLDINVCSPSAFKELVLSYAFSSAGYAEISSTSLPSEEQTQKVVQVSLVFLGENLEAGWNEEIAIDWSDFREYATLSCYENTVIN